MLHEYINSLRSWLDAITFTGAGIAAGLTLAQIASAAAIIAAVISAICGGIRIYDRWTYGPSRGA